MQLLIEGLDTAMGMKYSGNRELYVTLLGDFYKLIERKAGKIEKCLAEEQLRDYTIEVHALKNTARMIGATELSERCYELEQYGNQQDKEQLEKLTPPMLVLYRSYKSILASYAQTTDNDKETMSIAQLVELLEQIQQAVEVFDLDTVDFLMKQLEVCQVPDTYKEQLEELRALVADVAMEEIIALIDQILKESLNKES